MQKLIVLLALVAITAAEMRNYTGYKVFRVSVGNGMKARMIDQFAEYSNEKHVLWNSVRLPNSTADLMIGPEAITAFEEMVSAIEAPYEVFIQDVQALIDAENPPEIFNNRFVPFNWTRYHSLQDINAFLDRVTSRYPDKAQVVIGGTSYEGRQIKGIKLSFRSNNSAVFIEGGVYGREWISPAVATYLINELLTSEDPEVRTLAESIDWYIFPSVNPDGYVYTHTHDRLWRKTRKPHGPCFGADPNRNWGYRWKRGGSSSSPCSDYYAGPAAFSENETLSLANFITSISDDLYAYISFQSYSQLITIPYGHSAARVNNYHELWTMGTKAIEALHQKFGTEYSIENMYTALRAVTGTSMDWVKYNRASRLTYTFALRGRQSYGYILPADQIIPTGQEVLDSLVGLFKEARARGISRRG